MRATCLIILFLGSVLGGCATTYAEKRARMKDKSTDELCLLSIKERKYQKAAEDELAERKAKCDWDKVRLMLEAEDRGRYWMNGYLFMYPGWYMYEPYSNGYPRAQQGSGAACCNKAEALRPPPQSPVPPPPKKHGWGRDD